MTFLVNPDRLLTEAEWAAADGPAVALEAVDGPPGWSAQKANFDHHAGVPRPFYDCVCKQVLVATDDDLWPHLLRGARVHRVDVYLSRVDEDVALAVALLEHPELTASPTVRRLVQLEDALDRSGGTACADATARELGQIAWINEPYHLRRGAQGTRRPDEALGVLHAIVERVEAHAEGRSRALPIAGDLTVVARVGRVAVVTERGPYARLGLRRAGIDIYAAVRHEGGRTLVTVGLSGPFVAVDLGAVYHDLNQLERDDAGGRWGGGTHIGGSPLGGTALDTDQILAVLAGYGERARAAAVAR